MRRICSWGSRCVSTVINIQWSVSVFMTTRCKGGAKYVSPEIYSTSDVSGRWNPGYTYTIHMHLHFASSTMFFFALFQVWLYSFEHSKNTRIYVYYYHYYIYYGPCVFNPFVLFVLDSVISRSSFKTIEQIVLLQTHFLTHKPKCNWQNVIDRIWFYDQHGCRDDIQFWFHILQITHADEALMMMNAEHTRTVARVAEDIRYWTLFSNRVHKKCMYLWFMWDNFHCSMWITIINPPQNRNDELSIYFNNE